MASDAAVFFSTWASEQAQEPSTSGISRCIEEFISSSRRDYLPVAQPSHRSRQRLDRLHGVTVRSGPVSGREGGAQVIRPRFRARRGGRSDPVATPPACPRSPHPRRVRTADRRARRSRRSSRRPISPWTARPLSRPGRRRACEAPPRPRAHRPPVGPPLAPRDAQRATHRRGSVAPRRPGHHREPPPGQRHPPRPFGRPPDVAFRIRRLRDGTGPRAAHRSCLGIREPERRFHLMPSPSRRPQGPGRTRRCRRAPLRSPPPPPRTPPSE